MITPVSLNVSNFLSFRELKYDFQTGPVLIVGENRTDEGQENNGSGKTSIQSAIEMCVLDYTSRKKVRSADLIRRGEKKAELILSLKCPVRGEILTIRRVLNFKGSNELYLTLNEKPVSFATINDGDGFIIEWIGISKEDISNYYIVNKERFQSFFSSSNTQKLQLIGRFSNTSFMESVEKEMKEGVESVKKEIEVVEAERLRTEGSIETIKVEIENEDSDTFEAEKKVKVSSFNEHIEELRNCIVDFRHEKDGFHENIRVATDEIGEMNKNLLIVKEKLNSFKENNFEDRALIILNEIKRRDTARELTEIELREYNNLSNQANNKIAEITLLLKGVIKCPKCGFRFSPSDTTIDPQSLEKREAELRESVDQANILIDDTRKTLKAINDEIELFKNKRREVERESAEYYRHISDIRREISRIEENIIKKESSVKNSNEQIILYDRRIKVCEAEISEIMNKIDEVEKSEWNNQRLLSLQEKLEGLKGVAQVSERKVLDLREALDNITGWIFKMKEFKMYLSNIGIKKIQQYCNGVLEDMESDLKVKIDGFKMKADGTIKEEITPSIIRNDTIDFGSFSGGERGRLEYSMILAQQRIINETNPYGGLGFLFADEIAEGIDSLGLKLIARSLSKFNFPILITTHVMNQSVGLKILKVIKENNISRIEL